MKSDVETLSPTRVKLTVEVPYGELKPSLDAACKAIGAQLNIPGFRPGKVPSRLIEQRVGRGAIVQEAVNQSLPDLYTQAIVAAEVRPLGQPEVDITDVPVDAEGPLVFTAEMDVRPSIDLPDYATISLEVDALDEASLEAATQKGLTDLRERFGSLTSVERPAQLGDHIVIDLRGVIDGNEIDHVTGVSYEVGSATMLDGLDEAVTGLPAGEAKTFTAPFVAGEHQGQEAEITVTVTAVKVRELAELDDDFAQMASEFDTLAELTEQTREQARQAETFEQGVRVRDKLLEYLLDTLQVSVPESVIESQVHSHLDGEGRLEDQEHRAEVEANTRRALRTQFILDTIAEVEDVEVTQQELIEFLVTSAQQYGMDPSELAQSLGDGDQIPAMAAEVARRKALATVLERVTVTDTTGAVIDLSAAVIDVDDELVDDELVDNELVDEELVDEEDVFLDVDGEDVDDADLEGGDLEGEDPHGEVTVAGEPGAAAGPGPDSGAGDEAAQEAVATDDPSDEGPAHQV